MTDLQRVQLNMLKEFVRVCDELGLTYFLVCGSALGAVKYQGFIPWDDDLDVALPRPDYEIFCKKGQKLLPSYLFLQNHKTDPNYPLFMCKIRDNRTTFIEPLYKKIEMNHGVYIDVFPLDGYPNQEKEIIAFEKKKIIYELHRSIKYCYNRFSKENIRHPKAILAYMLYRLFGCWKNTSKESEKFHQLASSYWSRESTLWCNHGNWQGKLEYADKAQYGKGKWVMFEGLRVKIPEKYDEYLTQKYGDWRLDLPEDKKVAPHQAIVCDLNESYTEYIKKLR